MKKPFYKRWWFITLVVLFVIFMLIPTSDEEQTGQDPVKNEVTKEPVKTEAEIKADEDAKVKKEADQVAAEKEYYLKEIDTKVTTQMGMYDAAWNEFWVTTFEGVGNGTVSAYTAYDNMKSLEQRYDTLYSSFGAIEADGLSKENEKLFKEFRTDIKNAAMWRGKAAEKAQKMFDSGDVSPSKFDEIKKDVSFADNEMMTAVISLTQLQMNLGMIEETEDAKE